MLFEILGFFIGFRFFLYLRKKQVDPIETSNRIGIIIGATLGALIGSRLLGSLENFPLFWEGGGEAGWLYYYKSKTIIGGLLGGLIGVESAKKIVGESSSSGDLFTFPIILGMILGRIGCFLSGITDSTYGIPSSLPWAMDLGDGVLRHPTALYEIFWLGFLWIGLWLLGKNIKLKNGSRFVLFMVGYLLFRLFVESLKPGFRFDFGLTSLQIACILGLIYYHRVWTRPQTLLRETQYA